MRTAVSAAGLSLDLEDEIIVFLLSRLEALTF
jgi:hypothetical protein